MDPQPFAGIRVVEFGQFVAVPYAGQLLADGGADVLKIEALIGDSSRHVAPLVPGETRIFVARNRGKRSLPLALKHADAPEVIDALLAWADVALFNFRPGLAQSLGLDADTLRSRFPKLVTATVTPFGHHGPDAELAGMDIVVQARSGLMAAQGRIVDGRPAAGEPVPADYMCAMTLSFGIASALFRRERTGIGGAVDVSLMHAAMALANNQMVYAHDHDGERRDATLARLAEQRDAGTPYAEQLAQVQSSSARPIAKVYYRTFECSNKAIAVACGSVKLRIAFAQAIGLKDARVRAMDGADADEYYEGVRIEAETIMRSRTAEQWLTQLRAAGIPVSDVKMIQEMFDDEQALSNGMLYVQDHPMVGPVTLVGTPVKLDDDGFAPSKPTAPLGSQTRAILHAIGFVDSRIEQLLASEATREQLDE
jgi:CoA:oxalate CoA-transferase